MIVLLACFLAPSQDPADFAELDSRWIADEVESLVTDVDPVDADPREALTSGGRDPILARLHERSLRPLAVQSPVVTFAEAYAWSNDLPASADLAEEVGPAPAAADDSAGTGTGAGGGEGAGDGRASQFFGLGARGNRIVYVIDCSGSMNHKHDSEWKTRFRRLKVEITKAVGGMQPHQQFFIVFFSDSCLPMPARTLQPAVPPVQQKYLEWMARVEAGGETDPRNALKLALRLQPDVIYFLTDGQFEPKIERDLLALRQTRSAIHTFSFGDRRGEKTMKAVAAANGGEYHFVP